MMSVLAYGFAGALALALCGCKSDSKYSAPVRMTGDAISDATQMVEHGPKKDRVLWEYRAALAQMRQGRFDDAKRNLDDALALVGGVKTADKNARKARSYFHGEDSKTFVGEPYERVMAYYYRGILYWRDGQPDNARACFRSAQLEDSDAENKTYAADYVLLDYLDALATAKLAGDGSDADKRARELDKTHLLPPCDPRANLLFFIDFGEGPTKRAGGNHGEKLYFAEGHSRAAKARVTIDGKTALAPAYDDLYFQATTRGGRVMDHILGNKVIFKNTTAVVGVGEMVAGAALLGNRSTEGVGAGLLALGVLTEVVSAATVPEADTRSWDTLPQYLSFVAVVAPPGPHTATVEFLDSSDFPILGATKTLTLTIPSDGHDSVIYISDQTHSF